MLYTFTLMPPPELSLTIAAMRRQFAENFKCQKALRPPVHITLYSPFEASDEEADIFENLKGWASRQPQLHITLRNFGFFERGQHPVLFIDVVKEAALSALRTGLVTRVRQLLPIHKEEKLKPDAFNPHITLGYRDTSLVMLPEMKAAYSRRKFDGAFTARSFYLWRHNTKNWEIVNEFPFAPVVDGYTAGAQASLF